MSYSPASTTQGYYTQAGNFVHQIHAPHMADMQQATRRPPPPDASVMSLDSLERHADYLAVNGFQRQSGGNSPTQSTADSMVSVSTVTSYNSQSTHTTQTGHPSQGHRASFSQHSPTSIPVQGGDLVRIASASNPNEFPTIAQQPSMAGRRASEMLNAADMSHFMLQGRQTSTGSDGQQFSSPLERPMSFNSAVSGHPSHSGHSPQSADRRASNADLLRPDSARGHGHGHQIQQLQNQVRRASDPDRIGSGQGSEPTSWGSGYGPQHGGERRASFQPPEQDMLANQRRGSMLSNENYSSPMQPPVQYNDGRRASFQPPEQNYTSPMQPPVQYGDGRRPSFQPPEQHYPQQGTVTGHGHRASFSQPPPNMNGDYRRPSQTFNPADMPNGDTRRASMQYPNGMNDTVVSTQSQRRSSQSGLFGGRNNFGTFAGGALHIGSLTKQGQRASRALPMPPAYPGAGMQGAITVMKAGLFGASWKPYLMAVTNQHILLFKNYQDLVSKDCEERKIDLKAITQIIPVARKEHSSKMSEEACWYPFGVCLYSAEGLETMIVRCSSAHERAGWVNGLSKVCKIAPNTQDDIAMINAELARREENQRKEMDDRREQHMDAIEAKLKEPTDKSPTVTAHANQKEYEAKKKERKEMKERLAKERKAKK